MNSPFVGFPKIARFSRDCIVTEKIDGTNAQIFIPWADEDGTPCGPIYAASRTRWITPEEDNHGFAAWVRDHTTELLQLGPGRHFGEWWGKGINRGYGLDHKRFSLFNVARWDEVLRDKVKYPNPRPECCHVVPVLTTMPFRDVGKSLHLMLDDLLNFGSRAAPGFMKPEGVVIFHTAGNVAFKTTIEKDEQRKGES